jgi:two-component system, OmpR family, sensor histidine kinase SenX3
MDVLVAGSAALAGVLVGAAAVWAFLASERDQHRLVEPPASRLPAGVADVLAILRSSAVVLDSEDRVVRASPAAYSYRIVRDDALLSADLLDLARQVRRDGEIREAELELAIGPAGSRAVHARVAPLGASLVLLLVEDRTEARRVDQVRRDFIANVSHELKTPAGAISLLAEALADAADDPETVRRFAGHLRLESDRLSRLVHDVIELSRLQSTDPLDSPALVELDDIVAEAVDRSRLAADTRRITLVTAGRRGVRVMGDARQLLTAVGNLVDNAVRYADEDTQVVVSTDCSEADAGRGPMAEVSVTDEGPGIPEEDRPRVFERFYRVDAARSRAHGGTGLGLSIVKHVAAGHGGEVTVRSAPGEGSTFVLHLPAAATMEGAR